MQKSTFRLTRFPRGKRNEAAEIARIIARLNVGGPAIHVILLRRHGPGALSHAARLRP
ncbi:hypothetical protein HS125_01555 [bacterium]|nr:hypothetical protein [bacterium]